MERKKKDHKIASATTHEPDSNDLLIILLYNRLNYGESDDEQSKKEQNQPTVAFATKSMGACIPSHDNAASLNQQLPSILQLPYTTQNNGEQPSSSSKPCISAQSPPSIAVSQWHHLPYLPLNPASHQGHPLPQQTQSTTPLWLPQRPGYHMPAVNAPAIFQPFTLLGAVNTSCQAPGLIGGETSSKDHPQVPNFGYQHGFIYPGFPGPWDPSSWWGQIQPSQPPSNYLFPGAYGYSSLQTPTVPDYSASLGQSSQRGIIRPPAKLSQKHQQLWESQSAENVQLWTVIGQLQSELADYKSHITKLESEVLSLKQSMEESTAHVTGTVVCGQASKRGRPRISTASVDALPSPAESQPRTRGRKPKAHIFEKVILNKAENKVKSSNPTTITQQDDKKVSNVITNNSSDVGINGSKVMMPSFPNQVPQEISQMQMSGVEKNDGNTGVTNDAFTVLTQEAKGMDHRSALASFLGARNNGSLGWPYTITPEGGGRTYLDTSSQGFYNNGSVIRQGGKVIPGWSFANEEDASEEVEDAVATSAKDENEEEMGDDATSGGEEFTCSKGEDLPHFSNW
ncbi:uncharacterized protein LOC110642271 isoform X1 [Hevea brasiliensis]|uniref:uncharacterized protein LOC110642271 isoform X1 n=2 Tax=Hevea brasiliensis TaxID=3981 RepID=UPI00260049A5|nr:uncharacterized protein LOC110642271 isoform X1 [Hevea brasiliensis]